MRVLVTGATGFIGSHAARRLVAAGHEVAILARPESNTSRLTDILPRLRVVRSDGDLEVALSSFRPNATLHAAWQGVFHDRNDLRQIDNVPAAVALLQASIAVGCRCWVGLGSLTEYGPSPHNISEGTVTKPVTAYGAAKLAACLQTQEICRRVGARFVWLRLGSVYGPDDNNDWVVPFVGRTLLEGKIPALTSGEQHRDFLYVEDAAEAIGAVIENERAEGIYNLASGHAPPLRETLELLRDLIDPALPLGFHERSSEAVTHLQADPSRLCAVTSWQPRTTLEEGLCRTVGWLKKLKETQECLH
jgi:UDP-glucose 4-epimerase